MQNSKLSYIVVLGQVLLSLICVLALCGTLFYKNYADPATLSALIVLTGTLIGNLGSILGGPRQMMKAEIVNPPEKPVPVAPQPENSNMIQ